MSDLGLVLGLSRALRLIHRALARGWFVAHLGGLGVIALAVAIESAALHPTELGAEVLRRAPPTWAQLAPALTLAGAALAFSRLREQKALLGLQSLGVRSWVLVMAAGLDALLLGAVAAAVGLATRLGAEVVRASAGWWIHGVWTPDSGAAPAAPPSEAAPWLGGVALAAAAGALGLAASTVSRTLILAALLLCVDLLSRSANLGLLPESALAGALVLAALVRAD